MKIELPSLQFLFDTDIREAIMFDAVSDGQDCFPSVTKVEADFNMIFKNTYQFTGHGDGSWLGIYLGNNDPTEENVLSSPTLFVHSDCEPEIYSDKTLIFRLCGLLSGLTWHSLPEL